MKAPPENRTPRNTDVYGLLCGVLMSAWVLIEYALGFHTTALDIGQYSGFVTMAVPVVVIFIAVRERQLAARRRITFIEGINVGFRIALLSAFLFTLFIYFYNQYINPDWIERMVEWKRRQLILGGASNDEIARFLEQNRYVNTSIGQAVMEFISSTGIGVFITLIEIPIIQKLHRPTSGRYE